MLISSILVLHNTVLGVFLHKIDRQYTYQEKQLIEYKCPKSNSDMYLLIQTETAFEMIIGSVSNRQDQLDSKHCNEYLSQIVIQYGQCQSQITIIPTSSLTILQGFVKIYTLDDLKKAGYHRTHRLHLITFFKLVVTNQSIIWLNILQIAEITHPFELAIQQKQVPTFESQFQQFTDANQVIKFILVTEGTYYVIIACNLNLEYLLRVQEYGQSEYFIFLPQNTSSENLEMILATQAQQMFVSVLIGSLRVSYMDDFDISKIIQMDNISNKNFIVPSNMTIVIIETEFILVYYQQLSLTIGPAIRELTFIMNEWYQTTPSILIYPYCYLEFNTSIINFIPVISNNRQYYQMQEFRITSLIITKINITMMEYYKPKSSPEVVFFNENSSIKIQNLSHKRIHGLYTVYQENGFQKLVIQRNSIVILYNPVGNQSLQLDLGISYKLIGNQSKQQIYILSHEKIHYSLFPFNLEHKILYDNSISQNNNNYLLQVHNIRAIEVKNRPLYYYIQFFSSNRIIYLTKSRLILHKKYDTVVDFQHLQKYGAIQYFIINQKEERTCQVRNNNKKLLEGELIDLEYVLMDTSDCIIFFHIDYEFRCNYLYENQAQLIAQSAHYCHLVQQNFINFISLNNTMTEIYLNIQTLDAEEQISYPNNDQFDIKLKFHRNTILDLSFYDCLSFDCLLKITAPSSINSESFLKFKNCYHSQTQILQYLIYQQSIDLCNSSNSQSILQIYGSLKLEFQSELKCISDECHFIVSDLLQGLLQNFPLNITQGNFTLDQIQPAQHYLRYGTLDNGNILVYSEKSFISTQIPYTFYKNMNISTSTFAINQFKIEQSSILNQNLSTMVCVEYGNLTIQEQLIINDRGSQYCTIFVFKLIEDLYLSIYSESIFTVQFNYGNQFQIYLNQLNEFASSQQLSFYFYNPEAQTLIFHSNLGYNLLNLEANIIIPNDTISTIPQGYYQIHCLQNQAYVYFTAFAQATNIYNNITFTTQGITNWTILNKYNKKYIIIQIICMHQDQIKFIRRANIESLDFINNIIILKLKQGEEIITLNGNLTFRGQYVDQFCIFLEQPKLTLVLDNLYEISGEVNETCQFKFIEFQYKNSIQQCLDCQKFKFKFYILFHSQINVSLRSNTHYIFLVFSQENTFSQIYSYQCCEQFDQFQDNNFIIKTILWLVCAICIYIVVITSMNVAQTLNHETQYIQNKELD